MKSPLLACFVGLALAVTAMPGAWADANPDFDDDAKPILRMQPGLLQYVESRFDVKDTGTAKYPGDDDRRPQPPYIFRARPVGSHGGYNLRLLIQPGSPGHILGVVDITRVHVREPGAIGNSQPPQQEPPAMTSQRPPPAQEYPAPAQENPAPAQENPAPSAPSAPATSPSQPTSDTPSGPIMGPDNSSGQTSNGNTSNLAPPPDPAPSGN